MAGIVGGNAPAGGDGAVRPERAGWVLPWPRADRAGAAVSSQAGFTAIEDLAHGFGGGYLPPVVPAPGRAGVQTGELPCHHETHVALP
jgi:hypothetical protein